MLRVVKQRTPLASSQAQDVLADVQHVERAVDPAFAMRLHEFVAELESDAALVLRTLLNAPHEFMELMCGKRYHCGHAARWRAVCRMMAKRGMNTKRAKRAYTAVRLALNESGV